MRRIVAPVENFRVICTLRQIRNKFVFDKSGKNTPRNFSIGTSLVSRLALTVIRNLMMTFFAFELEVSMTYFRQFYIIRFVHEVNFYWNICRISKDYTG